METRAHARGSADRTSNLCFGPFELDLRGGDLRKGGRSIRLQEQPFQILRVLLQSRGQVVSREEIQKALWPDDTVVEFDHSINAAVKRLRDVLRDSADKPRYIETVARRGYRFIGEVEAAECPTQPVADIPTTPVALGAPAPSSIGVLPFLNLSADEESEYFTQGLTEEIINALARVPDLHVAARTSAFQFPGPGQDLRKVAELLKVRTLLEGSVRMAGTRLRVAVQLVDVAGGYQLWSERYDREMTDVFAVQDDIAKAIVDRFRLKLTNPAEPLVKRHTQSLPAYHAYLEGRYHSYLFTPEGLERSKHFFEKALREDPQYALAYAGLADYYYSLGSLGLAAPREVFPKAQEAAQKALALDETMGEAHASLGVLRIIWQYDWKGGEQEFERALELNPPSPVARNLYAFWFLRPLGRLDDAFAENARTLEVDPLSPFFRFFRAYLFLLKREYKLSIEQSQRVIEVDPNSFLAYRVLAVAYLKLGRFDAAIQAAERSADLFGRRPAAIGLLGCVYAWAGRTGQAEQLLRELLQQTERNYLAPTNLAWIYIALGQMDRAVEWIEKAVEMRDPLILGLRLEPGTQEYCSDPRVRHLLRRIGLPEIYQQNPF